MNAFTRKLRSLSGWSGPLRVLRRVEWNPVFVKEMRQAVRGTILTWSLMGSMALMAGVGTVALAMSNEQPGSSVFTAIVAMLGLACLVAVPFHCLARTIQDRDENSLELLHGTGLTPGQVIRGKLYAGAYLTWTYVCAGLPFLMLATLLGNVDLRLVAGAAGGLFVGGCEMVFLAVLLACVPMHKGFKYALMLLLLWGLLMVGGSLALMAAMGAVSYGVFISTSPVAPGWERFMGPAWTVAGLALVYRTAVALISPASWNRALPLRLWGSILWLLLGAASVGWALDARDAGPVNGWATITVLAMVPVLLVLVCQRQELSHRVLRSIPRSPWLRVPAWLLYNGTAGGLLWASALLAGTVVVTLGTVAQLNSSAALGSPADEDHELAQRLGAVAAYLLAYFWTGVCLARWAGLSKHRAVPVLAVALVAGAAVLLPAVPVLVQERFSWQSFTAFQPGNILNVMVCPAEGDLRSHWAFSAIWVALGLVLNMRWLWRQWLSFRPAALQSVPAPGPIPPRMNEVPGPSQAFS